MGFFDWLRARKAARTEPAPEVQDQDALGAELHARALDAAGPFVRALLAGLGERYRLGEASEWGVRLLCRHARHVYRNLECYVSEEGVTVFYDVRIGDAAVTAATTLIGRLYGRELSAAGVAPKGERARPRPEVVSLRFAGPASNADSMALFVDFYARRSEPYLDLRQHQD